MTTMTMTSRPGRSAGEALFARRQAAASVGRSSGRAAERSPRGVRAGGSRLTRRGRLVVGLLAVIGLLAVFLLGWFAASPAASAPPQRTVTVSAGQTLWQIARRVAPQADPRVTVAQIERLNHLDGAQVHPGQPLRVPGR